MSALRYTHRHRQALLGIESKPKKRIEIQRAAGKNKNRIGRGTQDDIRYIRTKLKREIGQAADDI